MLKQCFITTVTLAFCLHLTSCKDGRKAVVDSMVEYGLFTGMYLGPTDEISPQWKNYEALRREFSETELTELCSHKYPIVRCYAFKALTEIASSNIFEILQQHLADTAEFERSYGCIVDMVRVTDNFLEHVGYGKNEPSKFTLTNSQYDYIDSVLLFGSEILLRNGVDAIELISRRDMLERTKPVPHYYDRVREIVASGVIEALPLLAQYRNENDTSLFKKLLFDNEPGNRGRTLEIYVRKSIKYFPHSSFYPILKELLISEIGTNAISDDFASFPLYLALVQYPTKDARTLFETALANSGDEYQSRSRAIYRALQNYPSQIFDGVVKDIPDVDSY